MSKIKDFYQRLLFSFGGNANFILYKNHLFYKNKISVKNDRILFFKRWGLIPLNLETQKMEGEEFYLLLIPTDNLAHFFHDVFFPFYVKWRENKKRVCVSNNGNKFQREFLESVIDTKNLIFLEYDQPYSFSDLIISPEGRDLRIYPNFLEICNEIKQLCFTRNGLNESRTKNILYGRNELERKNLLDIDMEFLDQNKIELVHLSKLNFAETISILSKTKNFIYMVGAGVFYLLFLDRNVHVLEINPYKNNSWAQMFGLEEICDLRLLISQNIKTSDKALQGDKLLDSHVYFDESVKEAILQLPL